jgi:hypothetical protein
LKYGPTIRVSRGDARHLQDFPMLSKWDSSMESTVFCMRNGSINLLSETDIFFPLSLFLAEIYVFSEVKQARIVPFGWLLGGNGHNRPTGRKIELM